MKQKNQLFEGEKIEHCLENAIRKTSLGAIFSIPIAFVFARRLGPRIGLVCFGAGFGGGMSYSECRFLYDKNYKYDTKIVAEVELEK
eukprot:gene3798-6959_t